MYPCATGMLLVCTRMYPYVVARMFVLVCTRMYSCGVLVTILFVASRFFVESRPGRAFCRVAPFCRDSRPGSRLFVATREAR